MAGTRWVRDEVLAKKTGADLRVYAVWFSMVRGDQRSRWPHDALADSRVVHFWDESKQLGRWFARHPDYRSEEDVQWDAWFLYPPQARWDDAPSPLAGWGRPIVVTRDRLREGLARLLAQGKSLH